MPAQAGIQGEQAVAYSYPAWIPAFAGMTNSGFTSHLHCVGLLACRSVVVPPSRRPEAAGGTPAPQDCHETWTADSEPVMRPLFIHRLPEF